MKDQYYRELELEPGASPKDIKRAYFKLVRKFTPEKDPEKFRRIREAYEKLQENPEETGPSFQEPAEPFAKKMLAQIFQYHKSGDEILYRDACEEAYRLFPNETVFLYQMVQAQRKAGNTGKAVKSAELLVKKEPENKWFWGELAISYSERGFTRKAYDAFDRAYDLGCRDTDFILMYSMLCNDYGQYETGIRILLEMIDGCQKITGENQQDILEAFVGLVTLNSRGKGNYLAEILDKNPNARIVATAVTLESIAELTQCMKAIPFAFTEVVSMTVARDRKAGPYHLMMGQNPIFIFTMQGGNRECGHSTP